MSKSYNQPDEAQEKPYDFVPIARPVRKKTVGHEVVRGQGYDTGKLVYQLRVLSPVFVASGSYALGGEDLPYTQEPVVRACYRVDDTPAIPGSTLKGVVRSVVEAVSPSCVSVTRLRRGLIPYAAEKQREDCQPDNACPACSIFGRMSRMSKVSFGDAMLIKGRPQLYRLQALFRPRVDQAEHIYLAEGKYKGRKFYRHGQPAEDDRQPPVEVIPPDSLLRGELHFENLTEAELGLLIFALGLDTSFVLKLGGGKPTCLGSVRVEPGGLELRTREHFLKAEPEEGQVLEGETMIEAMAARLQAAYRQRLILSEQRDKLREIWRYPNEQPCPADMY